MSSPSISGSEAAVRGSVLRYASGGELHRDFHASILDGVDYVRENYGDEALRNVLFGMGTEVYRTLHDRLAAGDTSELLAWWRYYMDREGADYTLEETPDGGAALLVAQVSSITNREANSQSTVCVERGMSSL